MSRRRFDKLSEKERIATLFDCLNFAVDDRLYGVNRRTDAIGIACNYGKYEGVRRSDFDPLLKMTVAEVIARMELAAVRASKGGGNA